MRPGQAAVADAAWAARFERPWPASFYDRPTVHVARALLGSVLLRRRYGRWRAARIVETEAYVGGDPASHAFRGPTPRNRSMFGPPGTLYVYRIHQVHCMNAVARRGEAVLLRAAEPITPGLDAPTGPGRLCRAFGVTRALDGTDLVRGELRVAPGVLETGTIAVGPRVGIRDAADRPLRFALSDSPWVSRPRRPRAV